MSECTPLGSTMLPTTLLNVAPTITRPSRNPAHLSNPVMLPPVLCPTVSEDQGTGRPGPTAAGPPARCGPPAPLAAGGGRSPRAAGSTQIGDGWLPLH